MSEEKSRELQKEVEKAKEEVAKGEYDGGIWQLFIPLLLMPLIAGKSEIVQDVEKHGTWIWNRDEVGPAYCSECGGVIPIDKYESYEYCPHCGAKIDSEFMETENRKYNKAKDDSSAEKTLKDFVKKTQEQINSFFDNFSEDEFQKYLVHTIASEIEEIKRKQADMQCSIETLKFTLFNSTVAPQNANWFAKGIKIDN